MADKIFIDIDGLSGYHENVKDILNTMTDRIEYLESNAGLSSVTTSHRTTVQR